MSKQDSSRSLHAKSDALSPSAIGHRVVFVAPKNIASRMTSAARCVAIQNALPTDKAQFLSTGWNPVAFKTAAAEGDDTKLMNALATSGALLAVAIPAAITVVF